jgi:hypothetical protein
MKKMMCRSVGSRAGWSSRLAQGAFVASVLALPACGQAGYPADGETADSVGSSSFELTISDPATPLAVPLPQGADPLSSGLVVPADASIKGMWSATQPWPLNGLH